MFLRGMCEGGVLQGALRWSHHLLNAAICPLGTEWREKLPLALLLVGGGSSNALDAGSCNSCNLHALPWCEALPPELRTFELLNKYLADPPAQRLRAELAMSAH